MFEQPPSTVCPAACEVSQLSFHINPKQSQKVDLGSQIWLFWTLPEHQQSMCSLERVNLPQNLMPTGSVREHQREEKTTIRLAKLKPHRSQTDVSCYQEVFKKNERVYS
ncbi:hypothetical protein DPEC_G00154610 [Dallia pectoralis]|uniref:Uncharacterized protein n=1 Tax=Dallia pectoralis TaxID=75939 RepID=A0ACC2GKG8_DALPE|nr:hypothetical protein DPEC_G00154610 [Dallia pectoralis]